MEKKLVHCSYHKCLTVYFSRVLSKLCNHRLAVRRSGYRHFNSLVEDFYNESRNCRVASINNHSLDLTRLGDEFRITRLIRDPRDLVVSGYFYHKRGAESWCNIVRPRDDDWRIVNGTVPEKLSEEHSFCSYLQSVNKEEGLIAEIEFRTRHFESMHMWPDSDHRIKLFRYEDVVGNEAQFFSDVFDFYGFSWIEKQLGIRLGERYSAKKQAVRNKHIRNPVSGQWREHFTPRVRDYFDRRFGGLVDRYGYPAN